MPFEKGHKKWGGRGPGTPNKRTASFMATLEEKNFSPAEALIDCYLKAQKDYEYFCEKRNIDPTKLDEAHKYLKIAADSAKELASYAYPKLKSIDHKANPLEGMTSQQKLEAMKNAVALLEMQVAEEENLNGS